MQKKQNILITGSQGQLGKTIEKYCTINYFSHTACDKNKLNITNLQDIRNCVSTLKPTVIINCAAYNNVDAAEKDCRNAELVNGIGPSYLAIAAEEQNIPLVHFSTDYVFDGLKLTPYTISDIPNPINYYSKSKLLGEKLIQSLCRKYFIIRLSWVFGDGTSNFVYKLLQWSKEKDTISVVTDQISRPTYTKDIVYAIFAILDSKAYGIYHLANTESCSRYDWAKYVLNKINPKIKVLPTFSYNFSSTCRPAYSVLDLSSSISVYGELPTWEDATDCYLNLGE